MAANAPITTDVKSTGKGTGLAGSVGSLYERRWLLLYFIQRQLTRSYRGSFLGIAWLVVGPLLMVALYTLVFSELVGLRFRAVDSVSNYGLYLYAGLLPFFALSETVNKSASSLKQNSSLVKRVVFPLEVLPVSTAATAFVTQVFGLAALSALVLFFEGSLQWTMLLIPLVAIPQIIFLIGIGLFITVAGAYLPDLREALTSLTRIMMFATPIIWPAELAYDRGLDFIVTFNPLAVLVEGYRDLLLEGRLPDMAWLGGFTLFSLVLLLLGGALFVHAKKQFADVV